MAEGLLTGTLGDQGSGPVVETPAGLAGPGQFESRELRCTGHTRWIRICHWILAVSVLTLAFSGFFILMAHPRLYWGAVGNDLTPALFELPISRNYRHRGWEPSIPFFAAWFLVVTAAVYVLSGIFTGHARRHLVPRIGELTPRLLWQDLISHLRL